MRALFVTMAGRPSAPSWFMPDNGLAQLAACLADEGHDVDVLDLNTLETMARLAPPADPAAAFDALGRELAARVARDRVGLLGLKLWGGDGYEGSLRMAAAVRARVGRDVVILGGGPQVDFFGAAVADGAGAEALDAFVIAEWEPVLGPVAEVVEGRRALDTVPNLLIRRADGNVHATPVARVASIDALPLPLYDEAVYPRAGKLLAAVYEETRGCPYSCAFCNRPRRAGRDMRMKPPERAAAELRRLAGRHGFRGFKLGGSYSPSQHVKALARALIATGPPLPFCACARISDARGVDFALYREAGCEALAFGLESGAQRLLDRAIHKGFDVSDAATVLAASRTAGIFTVASVIYPSPGESAESRRATLDLLARARPDGVPVHFPVLLPGSGWFERPEAYGFEVPDRTAYVRQALRHRSRCLFPPERPASLPFRMDGKPCEAFAAESAAFAEEVEALGVLTHVTEDTALLARLAGVEPKVLRERLRRALVGSDVAAAASIVDAVNATPCLPSPAA